MKDMEEDYSNNIKKDLKIPYCNFNNISKSTQYEILMGLSLMYKRYPFFNHVLCSIEQEDDFIYHYNMFVFTMNSEHYYDDSKIKDDNRISGFYSITEDHELTGYYKLPEKIDCYSADYFSIVLFDGINECNVRRVIYHEFGHLLDNFLHVSCDSEFIDILKKYNLTLENSSELFAEIFSDYILGTQNVLICEVGNLVEKKYNQFIKNNIKENYSFNLKYSICLKDRSVN
ncbi:unknown [Clostridium sp. CAG:1000]|nr:unknown [Clostridium sp. CAG:1000]